jgi:hypothetical protein
MHQAVTRPFQVRRFEADLRYLEELARRNDRSRSAGLRRLLKEKRLAEGATPVSIFPISRGEK